MTVLKVDQEINEAITSKDKAKLEELRDELYAALPEDLYGTEYTGEHELKYTVITLERIARVKNALEAL